MQLTLLQQGGQTATWLKHPIDARGGTTQLSFNLSVDQSKDAAASSWPFFALVLQRESGLDALGDAQNIDLGGSSGIAGQMTLVFAPEHDIVKLVDNADKVV